MATHGATIHWRLGEDENFPDNRYSRAHTWSFDGGTVVPASASPSVVPIPLSCAEAVDPEEAFVASLASCHMLWFLSIAAKRGFTVADYRDESRSTLGRNAAGKLAIVRVQLSPWAKFVGDKRPTKKEIENMHHAAHENCFIANSVTAEIVCTPNFASSQG